MRRVQVGDVVRVGSLATRWRAAPIGTVEQVDPAGVEVRFAELVNGTDHCYASYTELTIV
ncbi:hypothetical protein ACFVVM_32820 [Nocardia sp. NPDC058176]|uniref:hypothetical protein n=1 Tax=Nocardia sp. NPDC058176 TaxID=3346368 RepID=UPI0036DD4938